MKGRILLIAMFSLISISAIGARDHNSTRSNRATIKAEDNKIVKNVLIKMEIDINTLSEDVLNLAFKKDGVTENELLKLQAEIKKTIERSLRNMLVKRQGRNPQTGRGL